jgi:hypothetical protein
MHCRLILAAGACRMADDEGGQRQRGTTQHCGQPECVSLDRRVATRIAPRSALTSHCMRPTACILNSVSGG